MCVWEDEKTPFMERGRKVLEHFAMELSTALKWITPQNNVTWNPKLVTAASMAGSSFLLRHKKPAIICEVKIP